jgi:hypothetical protein
MNAITTTRQQFGQRMRTLGCATEAHDAETLQQVSAGMVHCVRDLDGARVICLLPSCVTLEQAMRCSRGLVFQCTQ